MGLPYQGKAKKEEEGEKEKENNFEQNRKEPGTLAAAQDEATRAAALPSSPPPRHAAALPLPVPFAPPFPAVRCALPQAAPQKSFGKRSPARSKPFAESVRGWPRPRAGTLPAAVCRSESVQNEVEEFFHQVAVGREGVVHAL